MAKKKNCYIFFSKILGHPVAEIGDDDFNNGKNKVILTTSPNDEKFKSKKMSTKHFTGGFDGSYTYCTDNLVDDNSNKKIGKLTPDGRSFILNFIKSLMKID